MFLYDNMSLPKIKTLLSAAEVKLAEEHSRSRKMHTFIRSVIDQRSTQQCRLTQNSATMLHNLAVKRLIGTLHAGNLHATKIASSWIHKKCDMLLKRCFSACCHAIADNMFCRRASQGQLVCYDSSLHLCPLFHPLKPSATSFIFILS